MAIQLDELQKTFNTPSGPVEAVRGVELAVERGRDGRAARPERRRQVDRCRHAARAAAARRAARVSLFGRAPVEADRARRGRRDAADRRGDLRDLTVRELADDDGIALPRRRLPVDEVIELAGIGDDRRAAHREAVGRPDPARALRDRPRLEPRAAGARRADRGDGRRGRHAFWQTMRGLDRRGRTVLFATHYLEEADAVRRPGGADGRRPDRGGRRDRPRSRRMVGSRTIRATLPRRRVAALEALPGVSAAETHGSYGRPALQRLRRARSAPCSPSYPDARDIEIAAPASSRRSCELTATRRARQVRMNGLDLHPLRADPDVPQPPVLPVLARVSAGAVLRDRRPEPERDQLPGHGAHAPRSSTWSGLATFGGDGRDALERRAHRGRALGRLEPPAAADAALGPLVLPRQGRSPPTRWRSSRS